MKNKLAILALGAVLSAGLFATSASAVTVLPGSTTLLNLAGAAGDGYYDATVNTPKSKLALNSTKSFKFTAVAGFPSVDIDVSPSSSIYGVTLATWKDLAGGPLVTLSNVVTTTIGLIVGHTYELVFSVTHNPSPTAGAVISSFAVSPSAVPVPPAAILLLSGLVGIGALGRKRSGKVSV